MGDSLEHQYNSGDKSSIARRMRFVRLELYGEDGIPDLAAELGIPSRTWANYERGVAIPCQVLLRFLEVTLTNPLWLLRGVGPRYSDLIGPSVLPAICLN